MSWNLKQCSRCGTDKTYCNQSKYTRKDGTFKTWKYELWHNDKELGGVMCHSCFNRQNMPKWQRRVRTPRQLRFKGKQLTLSEPIPRIGVCNWCRAVIGEINAQINKICRRTDMHHETYHDDNPLSDSIELCGFCHNTTKDFSNNGAKKK